MSYGSIERLVNFYEDQFTPDGLDFVYRRRGIGAAYRVTADEKDHLSKRFRADFKMARISLMAFMVVGIVALAFWFASKDIEPSDLEMYTAIIVCIAIGLIPYLIFHRRAWMAADRLVASRTQITPAMTKEEARRYGFGKLTYQQLILAALCPFLFLVPRHGQALDPMHGWGRLWWLLLAGFVTVAAVQAYRKWSAEKIKPN